MKTLFSIAFVLISLTCVAQKQDSVKVNDLQLADLKAIEDWKAKAIEEITKTANTKQSEWYYGVMHAVGRKPEEFKLISMKGDIIKLETNPK